MQPKKSRFSFWIGFCSNLNGIGWLLGLIPFFVDEFLAE